MKNQILTIQLQVTAEERARLVALQQAFADICNALVPVVRQNRCWNRVGLHHLTYHTLRARFPRMGSQMVCNAIYSVSRAYRMVPKHPDVPLPQLKFLPDTPVFFDRHTVSIKDGQLSMYTLDGRVRFGFAMSEKVLDVFSTGRLREIVLYCRHDAFSLSFCLQDAEEAAKAWGSEGGELPEYIVLLPEQDGDAGVPEEVSVPLEA
ncbi:MAG: hypothetical protein LBB55_03525 [Zoogloeaceae bacterium]|jgi:hypothetical protein|nr:hypothetical protein [Zoogloeaceae bacterium]